jgi:hypothetical protein
MGLDGVELVLAVEDAFAIHMEDEEARKVVTVGDFYNLVLAKLQGEDTNRCLTSAAFYRTRRGFVDGLGMNRRGIGPSTTLEAILPRGNRRANWRRVQAATNLHIPDLEFPTSLQLSLLAFGMIISFTTTAAVYHGLGIQIGIVYGLIALVVGGSIVTILTKLSRPAAAAFPHRAVTVGDLSKDVLATNHAQLAKSVGSWNKKEVWEALCRVIVIQTGIAPENIKPEARIVKDLGVD